MDIKKIIAQLRAELVNLDAAIESLEKLPQGTRRRGRPPHWLTQGRKGNPKRKPRSHQDGQ